MRIYCNTPSGASLRFWISDTRTRVEDTARARDLWLSDTQRLVPDSFRMVPGIWHVAEKLGTWTPEEIAFCLRVNQEVRQ